MSSETPEATADRLHSAAIHLLRRLRKTDAESGLSGPRSSALSVLVFGGPASLAALAAAEQVRPPTMSRLVSDMEREGLVARTADPADGRGIRITATDKGRALLDEARRLRLGRLAAAIAARPPQERETLAAAARLMSEIAWEPGS